MSTSLLLASLRLAERTSWHVWGLSLGRRQVTRPGWGWWRGRGGGIQQGQERGRSQGRWSQVGSQVPTSRQPVLTHSGKLGKPRSNEERPAPCWDLITSMDVAEHFAGLSLRVRNRQHTTGQVFSTKAGTWSPQFSKHSPLALLWSEGALPGAAFGGSRNFCKLGPQRGDSSAKEPNGRAQSDSCMWSFLSDTHQPRLMGGGQGHTSPRRHRPTEISSRRSKNRTEAVHFLQFCLEVRTTAVWVCVRACVRPIGAQLPTALAPAEAAAAQRETGREGRVPTSHSWKRRIRYS